MKKKVVSLLVASMVLIQSIPVSAQDYGGIASQTQTAQVPSQFAVSAPDLSGVIVTLPANLDLSLDSTKENYKNQSVVSAKGDLMMGYKVTVSTASSVTYKSSGHPDVTGAVTFGTQAWTAAQLLASKTTLDTRDITVSVDADDVTEAAVYSTDIEFNIAVVEDN